MKCKVLVRKVARRIDVNDWNRPILKSLVSSLFWFGLITFFKAEPETIKTSVLLIDENNINFMKSNSQALLPFRYAAAFSGFVCKICEKDSII